MTKATLYMLGDREVSKLEGDEIIEFAGTAWRVDAIAETPTGDIRVYAVFEGRRLTFDVPTGTPLAVLIPDY